MHPDRKILFLTLSVFSITGGIEKVCQIAGKALYESQFEVQIFSMYDKRASNEKYFPSQIFKGFYGRKISFILKSIKEGLKSKLVILSHINLLSIGYLVKVLSPKTKLILFAHGIEVWKPLSTFHKKMLTKCDSILAVSNYTKEKLEEINDIPKYKCKVLNNCLDPFLPEPVKLNENSQWYARYNLTKNNFILITVTRIRASEQYKGHEVVLESLSNIIKEFPQLRYLIVGKYDISEKERLDNLIHQYRLTDKVIFTGFITDEELPAHYKLADVFIMPSYGEGFGIAFIEAMYYGLPTIAGNKDGSVDALYNGELGILVDPQDIDEISNAIKKIILNKEKYVPDRKLLLSKFSYQTYKENLEEQIL